MYKIFFVLIPWVSPMAINVKPFQGFCCATSWLFNLRFTFLIFHVSRLTSHVSRLTSHVSRLTSHVSRLTSHVSRLTSHVFHFSLECVSTVLPQETALSS